MEAGHIWQRAASFAARAHAGQLRKDGETPYYAHCVRVALTVRTVFGCEDETALAAALLHDTIEDTSTDYDDLHEAFGGDVADIVAALTKNMALPEVMREADYDLRLAGADWRARLIKLADVYDNFSEAVASGWSEQRLEKIRSRARRALTLAAEDSAEATLRGAASVRLLTGAE